MTQAQACQVAGVPIRTLKFRVQKGMSRLRRRLKPYAVEGLLGVGLFPPPDGGWEAAIGRWQGVAISAPAMAGIGSAIVAAVLLATAVSVVAWAVQDASPTDKSPHQAAVDAGSATTRSAVPPSEPSAGAEVLVDCPIVPPAVERAPDAGAVAGKVAASPSGPVPVGSTRVCFCYYESGFPQARWTERITPTGAVKEGDVTFWYPNGNVHHQGRLEDGAREGEWTRYWEDGRLSDRGNYRRSKREGFWMYMYDEGKPMSAGLCVNGLMEGQWRGWHENGQVSSEWTAVNDKFHGESRHYDEQGVLRQEINWDHGVKLREIRYDDQGNATTRTYENGKLVRTEPG
jgi:antitoxin component YwqK of YwqJK toxin-antitoxin module